MQPIRFRKHQQSTGRRRLNPPATWRITCPAACQTMTMQVGKLQCIRAHLRHVTFTHSSIAACRHGRVRRACGLP